MSESNIDSAPDNSPQHIVVGQKEGLTLFSKSQLDVLMQFPLPGIVIFVHGVNSEGEWYDAAEEGLCEGLNERLKRCDEHLAHNGKEAGQLQAAKYMPELDLDGFIDRKRTARTFINTVDAFSPVIRFRWGYKASGSDLVEFGSNIYLNEQNYWGGGPFANGCSSLPDLWTTGVDDRLLLWIHAQHINPDPGREVYKCPARPYFVMAAYRLARLVESIRQKQADVPITIVCHSQGNLIGIAAAFLGDTFAAATDPRGKSSKCVADTYVLCNPTYSLLESNFSENWSQIGITDSKGRTGRQTQRARLETMAKFIDIIRARQSLQQDPARIDKRMGNADIGFKAGYDREQYGLAAKYTSGRLTIYCNPHDRVISAATIQGIGWRGMSADEIKKTCGEGVFTQRVFAQGFTVGDPDLKVYDYWKNQYNGPLEPGSSKFWQPASPPARFQIMKGLEANTNPLSKASAFVFWPIEISLLRLANMHINSVPPDEWIIPLAGPRLPHPFVPEAVRFGASSKDFDQGLDAPADYRDKSRKRLADDSYTTAEGPQLGDQDTESSLRYENHAELRMKARRDGFYKSGEQVKDEDDPSGASDRYKAWRGEKLKTILKETMNVHAADHSTILTNAMHSRRALTYDVAVGLCDISEADLLELRKAADWRLVQFLTETELNKKFSDHFINGSINEQTVYDWANSAQSEAAIPAAVTDERTNVQTSQFTDGGA